MPIVNGHYGEELDALLAATAAGVTIHVSDRESRDKVLDIVLSREILREQLELADLLASVGEDADRPAIAHGS